MDINAGYPFSTWLHLLFQCLAHQIIHAHGYLSLGCNVKSVIEHTCFDFTYCNKEHWFCRMESNSLYQALEISEWPLALVLGDLMEQKSAALCIGWYSCKVIAFSVPCDLLDSQFMLQSQLETIFLFFFWRYSLPFHKLLLWSAFLVQIIRNCKTVLDKLIGKCCFFAWAQLGRRDEQDFAVTDRNRKQP